MRYAYYPGCSLGSGEKEYDHFDARGLCVHLGIDLVELADWNCCGAVHVDVNQCLTAAITLPGRNLALAQTQGFEARSSPRVADVTRTLRRASRRKAEDKTWKQKAINESLQRDVDDG